MTCPYRGKYEKGYRAFPDRVPGYAQGEYFPGDESGYRCRASGEICGNPDGDTPEDCAVQEETEYRCPLRRDDPPDAARGLLLRDLLRIVE